MHKDRDACQPKLGAFDEAEMTGPRKILSCGLGAAACIGMAFPASPARAMEGVQKGAQIVKVTTLTDSGPGSLRAAFAKPGPSIIVFEVGGYITLQNDLQISQPMTLVAGETAPGAGIVLRGGNLRVRASDVVLSHIAVFPGSADDPKVAENRDGISIYGSPSHGNLLRNISLRYVTAGWAVDENLGVQGLVDGLRVEHSLIAEGLRAGGHPKGNHSMNLLLGNTVRRVEILGNILAASEWRSARMTQGNLASMINNFVVGYGQSATHIDNTTQILNAGAIDVIGNAYMPGAESRCNRAIVEVQKGFLDGVPPTRVYLGDNIAIGPDRSCGSKGLPPAITAKLASSPALKPSDWKVARAASLYPAILDNAGSRPAARNPIDQRIIAEIREHRIRLIDNEQSVGGWPAIREEARALNLPVAGSTLTSDGDVAAFSTWLCARRQTVGEKIPCS
jgi:hypothetical protein